MLVIFMGAFFLQGSRGCPNTMFHSGTSSSFVIRFYARRAQKRITDKMQSTMLPFVLSEVEGQAKRRLWAALRKFC